MSSFFADDERHERKRNFKKDQRQLKREEKAERAGDIRRKAFVNQRTMEAGQEREASQARGAKHAQEVLSRKVTGLDPQHRSALQYEAHRGIDREHQAANRRLLGEQGQRGIVGKGGVAYAQQRDQQRLANEAKGAVHRDLDKMDSDLQLKKLAAGYNIEQGDVVQDQLDKQMALDELDLGNERKKHSKYLKNSKSFTRL